MADSDEEGEAHDDDEEEHEDNGPVAAVSGVCGGNKQLGFVAQICLIARQTSGLQTLQMILSVSIVVNLSFYFTSLPV